MKTIIALWCALAALCVFTGCKSAFVNRFDVDARSFGRFTWTLGANDASCTNTAHPLVNTNATP
jgi:hypothetical protein